MTEQPDNSNAQRESVNRRTAMKWGVGAATAAVVWNEPYVVGLAKRPTYAAAASTGDISGTTAFGPANPAVFPYMETNAEGFTITISETATGYLFVLTNPGFDCSITAGTFTGNGSGAPNILTEPLLINPDGSGEIENRRPFNDGTSRDFEVSVDYTCICL